MNYPAPGFPDVCMNPTPMPQEMIDKIAAEVKAMLHAHRDCLRNRYQAQRSRDEATIAKVVAAGAPDGGAKLREALEHERDRIDPRIIRFDCRDGYYGEAFGMMRTLAALGFGRFESSNLDGTRHGTEQPEQNLKWWFGKLEDEVLVEESFDADGKCNYCSAKYGKDDADL